MLLHKLFRIEPEFILVVYQVVYQALALHLCDLDNTTVVRLKIPHDHLLSPGCTFRSSTLQPPYVSPVNYSGPSCSKLTMSLVNVSLKFKSNDTQICCYFLLKKCEKLLTFFQQKISEYCVLNPLKQLTK